MDPETSLKFYIETLGFQLVMFRDFPQWGFSVYFVAHGLTGPVPADEDARWDFCMRTPGCIELTWNHGSEKSDGAVYNTGNADATGTKDGEAVKGGFGHLGITVPDVYEACERFKKLGCTFTKTPNSARLERRFQARVEVVGREVALVLLVLEDAEDRAGRDARVDVGRAVEGVEDGDVLASRLLDEHLLLVLLLDVVVDLDGRVLLLGREDAYAARVSQSVLQDVVRDDVELLLLLALDVDVAGVEVARQARQRTSSHQIRDGLRRRLDGREDGLEFRELGVRERGLDHEPAQGDSSFGADVREDGRRRRDAFEGRGLERCFGIA